MEKLTGVVLEKDGTHVVLLTPLGEFKRVRLSGRLPGIGEEVSIPVTHKRFFRMPKAGWIAAAAAVLLLMVGNPLLTMVTQPVKSGIPVAGKEIKKNPANDAIADAGGQLQEIINQAGEEKQSAVPEKKSIAVTGNNESEQAVAAANPPNQPDSLVTANEAAIKSGTDNTAPVKTKERRYVETVRKNSGPEDTGSNEKSSGVSAAAVTNPTPVKSGSEPVSTPPKDVTVVDDQKTVDNYMGPDQTSNSGSTGSADLSDMYKLKPNW